MVVGLGEVFHEAAGIGACPDAHYGDLVERVRFEAGKAWEDCRSCGVELDGSNVGSDNG